MTTIINLLDDDTRPKAPRIAGVTPAQRRQGRRLGLIHAMYLREIDGIAAVMERVEAGEAMPGDLAAKVGELDLAENYRRFGNLCGGQCHALTVHHMIEDQEVFPRIRSASEGLRKVVDRLSEEHRVIHAILERLDGEARALLAEPGPARFAELKATFELMREVVRSHFGYEQTELEEALGTVGVPI